MARVQQALIVAQNQKLGSALVAWLSAAGYEIVLVTTFDAARRQLQSRPDLVVTELKLGEFNGLHLAVRAKAEGIATMVLGPADPVLARDAASFGAAYFSHLPRHEEFLKAIDKLLDPERACAPEMDLALLTVRGGSVDHGRQVIH